MKKTPCCEYAEQNKHASKKYINDLIDALNRLNEELETFAPEDYDQREKDYNSLFDFLQEHNN